MQFQMDSTIRYQGCLLGVEKIDFTPEGGQPVKMLKIHVSTNIEADRGAGFRSEKMAYRGDFADYPKLAGLVGRQVLIELNSRQAATSVQAAPVAKAQ